MNLTHNFQKGKPKKGKFWNFPSISSGSSVHRGLNICSWETTLSSRPLPGSGGFMLVVLGPHGAGFVHTPSARAQSRSSRSLIESGHVHFMCWDESCFLRKP